MEKMKDGPFGDNIFFGKKTSIENFEQCHCAARCKRGTLWVFQHPFWCRLSKQLKGVLFGVIKKTSEKSHSSEKN